MCAHGALRRENYCHVLRCVRVCVCVKNTLFCVCKTAVALSKSIVRRSPRREDSSKIKKTKKKKDRRKTKDRSGLVREHGEKVGVEGGLRQRRFRGLTNTL